VTIRSVLSQAHSRFQLTLMIMPRLRLPLIFLLVCIPAMWTAGTTPPPETPSRPLLDAGFHLMYELKFDAARAQIVAHEQAYPADPLGAAARAASYLFEQFDRKGVLSSEFFLDDKRLLGGIEGEADESLNSGFLEANQHARQMAEACLKTRPNDRDGLLVLTLTDGMQGDFQAIIEKRQLASLSLIRRAEKEADRLLKIDPDACDAYLALGVGNYIVGSLPSYKRVFLWFGGIHGDRERGMEQLQIAAARGHYLRPLAKAMLALAAMRERQPDLARSLFTELNREYPENRVFAQELALLDPSEKHSH
jgi:hypothetical protein